ncbi:MAG: sensor histidine kinase [Cellvibrionaceae bacterium]
MLTSLKNIKQLRWIMVFFFIAIAIPAIVLSFYSYRQLKWEAFYVQRNNASELSERINEKIERWVLEEESRSFTDYRFLKLAGDESSNYFTPSPLSAFPSMTQLPGVIGFFQLDSRGYLTTPLLPDSREQGLEYGVTDLEYSSREQQFNNALTVLVENKLINESVNREYLDASKIQIDTDSGSRGSDDAARTFEERINNEFKQKKKLSSRYKQVDDLAIDTRLEETLVKNKNPLAKDMRFKNETITKTITTEVKKKTSQERGIADSFDDSVSIASDKLSDINKNKNLIRSSRVETNFEMAERESQQAVIEDQEQVSDLHSPPSLSTLSAPAPNGLQIQNLSDKDFLEREGDNITVFESEIDPFTIELLDSGHLMMYRKAWRNEQRFVQGILLDPNVFLEESIGYTFHSTQLSTQTDLVVAYNKNVLALFSNARESSRLSEKNQSSTRSINAVSEYSESLKGERLLQSSLIAPFSGVQLIFSIKELETGPGAKVVLWSSLVMALVLSSGVWLIYLLGVRQLRLAQQQQDFVSAVSHELKTPLTSIRMYGELLKEGWATEDKKKEYYHYIFDESERLSRLISNVLQLAKMNRGEWDVQLKNMSVSAFVDNVRSKLDEQVTRSGFSLEIAVDQKISNKEILIDADYLLQVVINLVDNAIKFSSKAENKSLIISVSSNDTMVYIAVRDHGAGIKNNQLKKIFELFYRGEDELTRETVGTGIGLALVAQLVGAMNGSIAVTNKNPGAEFTVGVPLAR